MRFLHGVQLKLQDERFRRAFGASKRVVFDGFQVIVASKSLRVEMLPWRSDG